MKNKILPILAVAILVFTSLNVYAFDLNDNQNIQLSEKTDSVSFSKVNIQSAGEYVSLSFTEANSALTTAGKPQLPICIKTYKFPIGTKIINVDFTNSNIKKEVLSGKIKPAPIPKPLVSLQGSINVASGEKTELDTDVYTSTELYPDCWAEYNIGVGLDGAEHVLILTVRLYPYRYLPGENTLYYVDSIGVKISYEKGTSPIQADTNYDLVIITPRRFYLAVLPLAKHKNDIGISTKIQTTESIYRKYDGRDRAEKIKYFIKDAIETYNTTYVLLVGARQGLGVRWWVPARYSNLEDTGGWNETFVSDLYYSDIYKYNTTSHQTEFDDWDSNGNGVFAEWIWTWNPVGYWTFPTVRQDKMDFYPDVYVGRLACRNTQEVRTVVKKIINYENSAYGQPWTDDMILFGGDTVPSGDGIAEGEYETNYGGTIMEGLGYNVTRIWVTNGKLVDYQNVIDAINQGAEFLYFSGHGSPIVWSTHPFENESWIDGLYNFDMDSLRNKEKLPVVVVGGCHNSQFDVAPINLIKGLLKLRLKFFAWYEDENVLGKWAWIKHCWSWNLITQKRGGAIASIGNSGLGWGNGGENCIEVLDGFITSHFFETYNTSVRTDPINTTLGLVHSQTINLFIQTFDPNSDELESKTIEEWILLGDPSLKIGGYPSS